jgi:hypothetical protein
MKATARSSSLKATARASGESESDPVAVLQRAQAEYEGAQTCFRTRQREILQQTYGGVLGLLRDDEACGRFMGEEEFTSYAGPSPTSERGDPWFHAVAFVYGARSRASRQTASKHAAGLRLLHDEGVDPDRVAETIKARGGIGQLASEAAQRRPRTEKESRRAVPATGVSAPVQVGAEPPGDPIPALNKAAVVPPTVAKAEAEQEPVSENDSPAFLPVPTPEAQAIPGTAPQSHAAQSALPLKAHAPADNRVQTRPSTGISISLFGEGKTRSFRWSLSARQAKAALAVDPKRFAGATAYFRALSAALKPVKRKITASAIRIEGSRFTR